MKPIEALERLGKIRLGIPTHPHLTLPKEDIKEIQEAFEIIEQALHVPTSQEICDILNDIYHPNEKNYWNLWEYNKKFNRFEDGYSSECIMISKSRELYSDISLSLDLAHDITTFFKYSEEV